MEIATLSPDVPPLAACALQQHPLYGAALSALGGTARRLAMRRDGGDIGQVQIVRRRFGPLCLDWLPRGPVWQADTDTAARIEALRHLPASQPGRALWLASPDSPQDAALFRPLGYRALMTPQYVAELDLLPTQSARLAAQHGKWRNRLRRAQASGLTVHARPFDPARDDDLLGQELAQRRTRRYAALPPAFTHAWAATAPQATRLYLARNKGQTVAFMLMLLHAPAATYHIGWSGAQGRALSAHHLILWHAASDLAGRGFARLDLGHVDTHGSPGLARFKIGAGAHIRPLGPAMIRLRP